MIDEGEGQGGWWESSGRERRRRLSLFLDPTSPTDLHAWPGLPPLPGNLERTYPGGSAELSASPQASPLVCFSLL